MHLRLPRGATTLVIATMLLISATLIVMFGASYSVISQRITSNQFRNDQAFEAAEAGLEYGIVYLLANEGTVTGSPSGGHINYTNASLTNVVLSNSSKYSLTYTNPTANNYNLIMVSATGVSSDATSTHTLSQLVELSSILYSPGSTTIVSKGNFTLSGNATITNTSSNTTINTGGAVSLSGNAKTVLSSGTSSTPGNLKSDVTQNNSTLANESSSDFFASYFGAPASIVSNSFANVYNSSGTTNYASTLNGMSGTTIWINQPTGTATFTGNMTLGTAANPVLLVINGQAAISGNVTIYGFVFIVGATTATTISGNFNVTGALVIGDAVNISGNANLTYSPSVNSTLKNSTTTTYNAKVPGSWVDF